MKKTLLFLSVATIFSGCCSTCSKGTVARSPDGRNEIRLFANPLSYEVVRDGVTVVARSGIALRLADETLSASGRVARVTHGSLTGAVEAPVYKKGKVDLSADWMFADYGDWGVRLIARNDGVAYRFETKKAGKVKVVGETNAMTLPDPAAKCWVNFTGSFGCEETTVQSLSAKDIVTGEKDRKMAYLPFVYTVGGKTVAVTESDVRDYPIWNLTRAAASDAVRLEALFGAWPKKTARCNWNMECTLPSGGRKMPVVACEGYLVETDGTRTFPWRTFVLADAPAKLCEADTVWALAAAQDRKADFSWVKPGKVAWDWWNDWNLDGVAFKAGCNTKSYEYYIDFAAKTGVEYVIFDEGWSENLNIWKFDPNVDVPHLIDYANRRGVGIILWMAWAQAYGDEARVIKHFAKLGAKGFKVDFMDRGDADVARFLETFAAECAKEKMLVDYHGAWRPTGLQRTYPNIINVEGIHGLEQAKWYKNNYDFMASDVRSFFCRLTAGPMDYTPGAMDNYPVGQYTGTTHSPGSVGTRCRQMAMMAMYEAPLQMLCDSPTKYEKNKECFSFMAAVPVVWDDTVGLGGDPDTFAAVARKAKDGSWYAAAMTNAEGRDYMLVPSFLGEGEWKAEIFRDAPESDKEPMKYVHETKTVRVGDTLAFRMAPGGGFVVKFSKVR